MNGGVQMIGRVFTRLTVKERVGVDAHGRILWNCLCECGKTKIAAGQPLRRGHTKSCGCLLVDVAREKAPNMTNRRLAAKKAAGVVICEPGAVFGKLALQEPAGRSNKDRRQIWRCACECGTEIMVEDRALQSGRTKSCGCDKVVRPAPAPRKPKVAKPKAPKVEKPKKEPKAKKPERVGLQAGQKLHQLTLLEMVGRDKTYHARWRCVCDCGTETVVTDTNLTRGYAKSCGCLKPGPKAKKAGPADNRPAWRPQTNYKPLSAPAQRATGPVTVCPAPTFNHRYGVDPASVPRLFSALRPGQYLEVAA